MLLLVLAYFGGVLTILSPCILPVLPFVFARSDQPFRRSGLPLLTGMGITFAVVASLATVGGGWAVRANQYGRIAALVVFAVLGLTLLLPSFAERLSRPLVRLGSKLSGNTGANPTVLNSLLLGIGTGLLWTPCAGPILGLILTGAAISGASAHTTLLLLAYALGAASSLAVALLAGGKVFGAMKRSLGAEEWIRRALGLAVLAGVAIVGLGLDRGVLTQLSLSANTSATAVGLEQRLLDRLRPTAPLPMQPNPALPASMQPAAAESQGDGYQGPAMLPAFTGATAWLNLPAGTPPPTPESLRGKVVLIDFWTYSCINCLRTLPYLKAWNEKYKDDGLVIIGVHAPEFPFEKNEANVRKAIRDLGITYPVVMDNDLKIWRAFNNQYWPAHYFFDATGHMRYHHFGEGNYAESEQWIRGLLEEANQKPLPSAATSAANGVQATGAEAASNFAAVQSPETYVGYERSQNFAGVQVPAVATDMDGLNEDTPQFYRAPATLKLNQWALDGRWRDGGQIATQLSATGSIVFQFQARDLHLVLGPAKDGKPIRFKVTLDGAAPGEDHGVDTDADGFGTVTEDRLYQLVRQKDGARQRRFRIEFESPGVQAFAFTFG